MLSILPKKLGAQRMSAIVEAQSTVRDMASPFPTLKQAWRPIARRLGISPRRVRSFYEGSAEPSGSELDRIRSARLSFSQDKITTELLIHAADLEGHAARLALLDPDFYGPDIARLRDAARRARSAIY